MATAWVVEYRGAAVINGTTIQAPLGFPLRVQKVTFSTSTATANAIGDECGLVGIYVDTAACFEDGASPTATTSSAPIAAGVEKFIVMAGNTRPKIAFITQA